jgi:uncharacterized protein Yka (UPF0111/DUF47 family)
MGWLHKIFGREDQFFELLEAGAEEARTSVTLLTSFLQTVRQGASPPELTGFTETRRKQKRIRTQTIEALGKTVIGPIEREDVQALAFALYRIPKVIEKLVERISIYPGRLPVEAFQRQAELLTEASEAVVVMVKQLRAGADLEKVREINRRLQQVEGDADKLMLTLLGDLYRGPYDQKEVVILHALYELLERAVDRCRTAGNIVVEIALKHA